MTVTARNLIAAPFIVVVLLACRGGSPPTVATDPSTTTAPSTTPAPSIATPVVEPASSGAGSDSKVCLMVNVCSCNLGCASIPGSRATLREGMRATVVSGALQGKEVKVVRAADAAGTSVLSLTDLAHDHFCSRAAEKSLMGYVCASANSGAVPVNACASPKACD